MYILIADYIIRTLLKETRMNYVKRYYNELFQSILSITTFYVMVGVRHLSSSMRLVYWLILTILFLVSSAAIWLLEDTSLKELESESTREGYVESIQGSEVERSNTLVLYLFLKNLRQRLSVALKME